MNISSSEEDYLTPISFPDKESTLPAPPQKNALKPAGESKSCDSLEGLDITLSQLTLTGLNELAQKLNIPAGQLSNMTLVQLTNFLSNFIKSNSNISEPTVTNSNEFPHSKQILLQISTTSILPATIPVMTGMLCSGS